MKSKPHKNNNRPAQSSSEVALHEHIEKRAHEIWLAAGCRHGDALGHWLQAESEVLKECGEGDGEEQRSTSARTRGE